MVKEQPTISISLSRKVNLGNYESADVYVCLSGLPEGATEEDMSKLMETGALAYKVIAAELRDKVETIKSNARKTA